MDEELFEKVVLEVKRKLAEMEPDLRSVPPAGRALPDFSNGIASSSPQESVSSNIDLLPSLSGSAKTVLSIDLPDPADKENRRKLVLSNSTESEALALMMATSGARIGCGRAGPRYTTSSWLLFQADHAVTQDALYHDVDSHLLESLGLFSVSSSITGGKDQYLLRPDLGRRLDENSRREILQRCRPSPDLQICVGDGLSAEAVEANLTEILPVIRQGADALGWTSSIPFFIRNCRVGVMNDIGELLHPDVLVLLIGERPGLGRARSLSAYMAYQPKQGDNDSHRDVICNIFNDGGTNPLEAGAAVIQLAQIMKRRRCSGVTLKLALSKEE